MRSSGLNRRLYLKSYLPSIFSRIRTLSGVSDEEFEEEWNPTIVAQNLAAKGAGKSGALFVASKNRKFLLKTLRKEEKDTLKAMATDLAQVRYFCCFFFLSVFLLCLTNTSLFIAL
jgi:hypothetical protein